MSLPNLTNNIIQQQNIVINQVPLSHAIMTNVNSNNGIPIATAITHQNNSADQTNEIKSGIVVETIPIAGTNLVGVQTVPVQGTSPVKAVQSNQLSTESMQVLTKTRMADLIRDIDPNIHMEDEVEEILLSYIDEFVDRVLNGASIIAKHRHVNNIEVKDVQQFINRNFNMWVPGLGTDELKPYKRSLTTETHKQRLALIRKALKKY
ncbi:transcription initiation factor tfiid subunit 12 [Holotrichia oblita]|uniref:Transcription initiation factor tfiid subunit 12 n=1 Tax=Holotrichia oblita TaxID=644536 RepID=A0ACB9TDU6_HOLOL|nr:transcription initiation factor tfiid subunit 12 [Holotrichia oblita]